ncbi:TlpA family protein disulfide reductase [Streptomyces sp. NPDC053079]|uniref:TlpA family protein disulfide reductase n=1 Tax=Streptomyces sp. NPDC053079 TaxID=3365697 RepID=UPI0037D7401E
MGLLVAVVVVLVVTAVLNLTLSVGLVRRIRRHTDVLNGLVADDRGLLPVSTRIPEFTAVAVDGTVVGKGTSDPPELVVLLSADCPACHDTLPDLVAYIGAAGHPPERVLAVVCHARDGTDAATAMVEALAGMATVVEEPCEGGVVGRAFSVDGFPSFYGVDGGVITAAARAVHLLAVPRQQPLPEPQ